MSFMYTKVNKKRKGKPGFSVATGEGSDQSYEEPIEKAPVAPPRPAVRNEKLFRPPVPTPVHQHQVRPGPEPGLGPGLGRKQRPPSPPQYDQEETYEDPDAAPPTTAPSVPALPTRRKIPSPPPVQEETYEDPDAAPPTTAPSVPFLPIRRKIPSPPPVQEDTYEEPDAGSQTAPPPPVPSSTHRRKAPSPVSIENGDEEYEEPDPEIQAPAPGRRPPRMPAPAPPRQNNEVKSPSKSQTMFQQQLGKRPPLPIPTQEPDEVYEDPDNQVVVLPTHGGPLPTPPSQKPPPVASNKLVPPPRQKHGRLPDLPTPPKPTVEPEPEEQQDVYEIPEEQEKPKLPGRRELPPTPQESQDQDDYLEMDDTSLSPPPPARSKAAPVSKAKPSVFPRSDVRQIPEPEPQPVEEECYEDPDPTPEPPARRNKETKGKKPPIGAVPILPGMMCLNVKEEEPKRKPPASNWKRELPPPPSAEEPEPEAVKHTPVKPSLVKSDYVKVAPNKTESKSGENKFSVENKEGDLDSYPWYHGDLSRGVADARLKQKAVDGMYCIRTSSQGPDRPYVLVVFYENKVYNLTVRRRSDHKYALGSEKKGEHSFPTLLEMVNFFKKNYLVIHSSDSGQTRLVKSLPKS